MYGVVRIAGVVFFAIKTGVVIVDFEVILSVVEVVVENVVDEVDLIVSWAEVGRVLVVKSIDSLDSSVETPMT